MYSTSDSFSTQLGSLATAFKSVCGANALFYWGSSTDTGLRLECGAIAKEFVDNVEFGHDPEGILFYDDVTDFDLDNDDVIKYKVYKNSETPPAISINFFINDSTTRFCAFITKDTNGISATTLSSFLSDGSGKWQNLQIATSYGKLHKISNQTDTELKLFPIGKKVTFNLTNDGSNNIKWKTTDHGIDITGMFSYRKTTDLKADTTATVDINEDRVIFYNSNKYMLGVFFPSKAIPVTDYNATTMPTATFKDI